MQRGRFKIIRLTEVNSTNLFSSALLSCGLISDPSIVITDFQTEGRGQGTSTWTSAPGENLLFSIIGFPLNLQAGEQFYISKIASVSVRETVSEYTNHAIIKWPNDVLAGGRKISGILIENIIEGNHIKNTIIGIGLNVNQASFNSLPFRATSLRIIKNSDTPLDEVLEIFIRKYEYWSDLLDSGEFDLIDAEYFKHLYGFNRKIWFNLNGIDTEGMIMDVERDGRIVIRMENGEKKRFSFKDIMFLPEKDEP